MRRKVICAAEREELGEMIRVRMHDLLPTLLEWKRSIAPIFPRSILDFFIGLLPGPSTVICDLRLLKFSSPV